MQPNHQGINLSPLEQILDLSFLTVAVNTSVLEAIALFNQTQASCVLIVEKLQLVGIFTTRDVVRLVVSGKDLSTLKLAEVMTKEVVTLTQSKATDAIAALSLMRQYQIHHLPIVDESGQLLGLVTQSSLLQGFIPTKFCNSNTPKIKIGDC
ncbi:CBS domain-containing protein [Synechocystis sp. PCC 7509]|uniref:CBS domain-containing protein n=1 Tax=Synechocystis sp. PCC 7509 TaxID=927677 RepID=UPI0002ABBC9A|nr:CBS domain-containing protein [Synechocystis sp. PCC 7509]